MLSNSKVFIFCRLDCGTGPGVVRSNSKVVLNQWNQLAVNRHDWGVWIQLNQGHREEGRSQVIVIFGEYSL